MLVRAKRGASRIRRRRNAAAAGGAQAAAGATPVTPNGAAPASGAVANGRQFREDLPDEDHAIYTCECGYVFEADVSTSVGCPHCGRHQAW